MKKNTTPSAIRLRGHQALHAELGPVGFIRFIQQYISRGDYTKDREKWIDQLDLSDVENRVTPARGKQRVG